MSRCVLEESVDPVVVYNAVGEVGGGLIGARR